MAFMRTEISFVDGGHAYSRKRPRTTLYDWPQLQTQTLLAAATNSRWMQWLVNPAKRLVASGLSFLNKPLEPAVSVSRGIGGVSENHRAGCAAFDYYFSDSYSLPNSENGFFLKDLTRLESSIPASFDYDFPDLYSLPNSENGFFSKDLTRLESFTAALSNSANYEKQPVDMIPSYDNLEKIAMSCGLYLTPGIHNKVIYDPCWYGVQEEVNFVDVQYQDNRNVIFDIDKEKNETGFVAENAVLNCLPSVSNQNDTFEDLTYPKGDPDPVTIGARELEMLQPGRFINDTIIDFYIKYLKSKIPVEDQHRFHFFNSFFSRKLADLDKNPSSVNDGKVAFQHVRKWTRKVNLFEKEYIFIPVNYSLHWSLIIICNPGEVVHLREDENEISPKVPCILHMDSLKGTHKGLNNLFQSYLCEEWKDKYNQTEDKTCLKFLELPFISPEVPQQKNSHDCGLFLLHHVELFLEAVLGVRLDNRNLGPSYHTNFLNWNWFPNEEASLKREQIQKLIYEIAEHSRSSPSNSVDKFSTPLDGGIKEEIESDDCLKDAYKHNFQAFSNDLSGCFVEDFQEACQAGVAIGSCPKLSEIEAFLLQDSLGISSDLVDHAVKESQEECMLNTCTVSGSLAAECLRQNDAQPDFEVGERAAKRRKLMPGTQ